MASGKSTTGARLARHLGYAFVDLDASIEASIGRSISEIFVERGEAAFRAMEREALRRAFDRERVVVAPGGGALTDPEMMEEAKTAGCVVYLQVTPGTVIHRVQDPATRPLLCSADGTPLTGGALRHRVETLLMEREAAYRRAHLTVDANAKTKVVARRILDRLDPRPPR